MTAVVANEPFYIGLDLIDILLGQGYAQTNIENVETGVNGNYNLSYVRL